ncbi:MAG TPA: helix-turn-helix domain-containing protein, partial [Bdellovibrio sp.]|uniref:helix-turn-helix domain-containing protein n=1 Tax=Bdellovibrio sp. TaxID=28201 RepID=UPI002EE403EA
THSWPGNVRELENLIERSVILSETGIEAVDLKISKDENAPEISELGLPTFLRKDEAGKILPIEVVTRLYIKYALEVNKGAKDKTARDLGIDRKTLYRRLRSISADKP